MAILYPEREDRVRQAFSVNPETASDLESRVAAETLAKEALTAQTIAEMPEESFKTEDEKFAAASMMVERMTGEKDLDGRLWNGGKPFKTGADYLRSAQEVVRRGMSAAADPDLQEWMRMTDEEKDAKLEAEQGILSRVGEAAGDVLAKAGEVVRGVPRLSKAEYESAPEDVREASDAMGSVMWDDIPEKERGEYEAKVSEWRGDEWQRLKRRGEYEAKLRRKNALLYLPEMIKSLQSDDAKELADELSQNPSEMPRDWTARLKKLPTRDIETLAQIRGMTREHVEGGFFNWLGDMAGGVYNGAHGILSGMGAQEAKIAAMAMGWDGERVNEMINRKHALWSAYAGWASPVAQLSDEHGAVANFTIGLASAVPFIASMHLKGLGYAACATEMMSEADAQAAAAGIDTTNPAYVARSAVAGGLYAYMLKAVSPKFLGASANGAAEEMALRTAFMKGLMSAFTNLDAAKVMSQRTASGALMMAMQQGIAAVNEDLNLGGDAWRDAGQRFTETFVSSLPDMLAFSAHGVLEGHARASGGWRKMFTAEGRANRSQNLREAVENAFAVRTAVDGNERIDALRTNTAFAQIAAMRRAWTEGGENGLARLGFKPEEIAEAKDFFEAERKALGAAEKLDALDRATDAESLEEIAEDAPLAERNAAARRFDEANGDYSRAVERLAETLRGKTADAPGVVRDLEAVRNVWAQGNAVGAGRSDGTDAGAAALVKAGFAPEDAAALSKAFGVERRGMYSPAATEALRDLYTRSTRGRVEATAALASAFGGRVRTENGRTFIDLPMPDGGTGTLAVETTDLSQKFYGEAGSDPELARQVERATGSAVKADDWIRMDDAARRRAVKKHRLVDEGDFVVTDPADPSLHVSSGDAETVFGTIRLDPTADPGAAFHEAMHGFLRFCQETGFFDEADLKWLTDTYGKPQNAREQLNEEAAADGFRNYLAKRMAGAITDEPGPFRKLFGLIGRLRHLREARAATERLATNAEEALYDAFLAGRYQHIRDLAFAEPAAPKAGTGNGERGTEAPQTGAKPKEPAKETKATEATTETPPVASVSDVPAVPSGPRVVSFEALTPTGGKKVKGHYEIVPLAELLHSNKPGYPMELQQRDRKDNKGEAQTREDHIANFEAGYLLADPKTDSGAMVVARRPGPDGKPQLVVVSGNGRTMVLEEMANRHLYDRYRNRMKEWAAENGVENAVADADNPVLVRVVDDLGGATLKELADLSNTNAIQQMNEEEQARADADLVRSLDLARLYRPNMDGSANMAAGASDEFFRAFVHATGDTSLLNSDGTFTEALRMRARRALLAIACGQGERGRDVVKKLVEDTDALGIDRQKEAAAAIAPHVAATESRPEYAIGPDVSRAFADYIEFRENRDTGKKWGTLENYLKQGDMLDQRSEIAEAVMRLLDDPRGAPVLAETVRLYAEAAKGETDGLFGAARTRAEIWRDAAKAVDEKAAQERARSEAAFKPETRFSIRRSLGEGGSIRSEADGKKDEEKKETTAQGPLSESDQTPPVQFSGGATSIPLTPESADPVTKFGDSISQGGARSPADFLTGLVHALGSTETNPDKTQYFDITHEDGRNLSLRVANHRATAGQYREHGNTAEVKTSVVVKMSDKPFKADRDVELTEHVYFSDKLTAEREAGIARAVAEWIATGEWNGPAADQVNMSPRRRYSIAGVYTGTAADYANRSRQGGKDDGPSLLKIGTGEGSQVYGWGLYGSTVRGVAEGYADNGSRMKHEIIHNGKTVQRVPNPTTAKELAESEMISAGDVKSAASSLAYTAKFKKGKEKTLYTAAAKYATEHADEYKQAGSHLYEQTFFTDRAPGDDSHLLKWYDAISDANWDRVIAQAEKEGLREKLKGAWWLHFNGDLEHFITDNGNSGDAIYERLSKLLGGPQSASEFLARAGIDGVKYPVDSYGGKGVKDGDAAGWNYVSFRDDNIRVDHKWTDGQMRYSIAGGQGAERLGLKGAAEAEAMEKAGAEREDIWRKTGWWKGKDGKWRFELPSARMKGEKEVEAALRINDRGSSETTLEKLLDAPELFRAYPQLKDTKITLSPEHNDEAGGWYDVRNNEIVLFDTGLKSLKHLPFRERDLRDTYQKVIDSDEYIRQRFEDMDALGIEHGTAGEEREYAKKWIERQDRNIRSANETMIRDLVKDRSAYGVFAKIVHEVQHAVQRIEGFARGGSVKEEDYARIAGEVEARNVQKRLAMSPEERAATPPWATEDVPADRQIVRYSIAQTTAGERFVLLDRPNQIDWNDRDKVREYLTTLVGTGAVSFADNQRIEIGKELPDEYTRSRYAEKAFRNVRLRKVRGKTAQHLDELIAVSGERTAEPSKHKKREGGVYYRRAVNFGVFGHEVKRGYSAELVSYEENGQEYLYDLVNIQDNPSLVPDSATGGNGGFEILSTYNGEGSTPQIIPQTGAPAQGGRYSIAGQQGAKNMGIKGAAEAEAMEKAGADREEIWRKTGWWRGKDGQWRVEVPDVPNIFDSNSWLDKKRTDEDPEIRAKINDIERRIEDLHPVEDAYEVRDLQYQEYELHDLRLGDFLKGHPLLKAYPELAEWVVNGYAPRAVGLKAGTSVSQKRIDIGRAFSQTEEAHSIFLHELQHAIQSIEGFAPGLQGGEDTYHRSVGEVEARNVQKRLAMSPEERAATPPWATEDVPEDRQIVRYSIVSLAGRDVAVVDDLDAARSINPTMPADVEKYILDHLEDGIQMMAGGTASINAETARHFAWSKVRGKYNTNRRMRKARAQSAIVFRDLVEMFKADDTTKQEDYHKQGDEVWKCRLPFGVPQFESSSEKIAGGIVYDADVIIKDTGDGKFLYDVADLKRNEALTQQLTSQAQVLFGGGKRAVETVSARAPGEAPTLTAMADLSAETLSQLYERHLTGESATSAPEGAPHNIPKPSDEIKADPEAFARRSVVARAIDGEAEEKESALVAFVAERALRHGPKPNAVKTIARLGLEMGLKTVNSGRIIQKGEALAERVRGTVIEKAVRNGDVATATAMLARESDIDNLVAGAAGEGGKLVRSGEGKIKSILDREIEKTVRSFNAASLADVERDTGIDIAGEILANSPEKFDPSASAKATADKKGAEMEGGEEGSAPGESSPGDGSLTDYEIARRQRVRKEAEERVAKMIATAKERSESAKKEREEWEAKRDERKRRAEEAAASGEGGGESGEGGGEGFAPGDRPKLSTFADFKTPEEFAAFFRVWAEDRYKKEHGASSLGKHEEKRLFPEFYRKAVVRELQDLADKLLPPKGARATVNRWLGDIQPGVRPDTLERISADVFAYINRNAIRESRTAQIQKFRNGLQEFVKGPQFEDLKLDADRKVTGWVEEAARYIRRVCNLSIRSINGEPSQLEKERAELQEILDRREKVYDDEGKNAADAPKFDMETRRALAKLQLLDKYGAMKRYMPGEIADLADEAVRWLQDEAVKLEAAWKDARETEESIRGALVGGIVGPNGQKYKRAEGFKGWAEKLFDSMNGMIRLRLQHLVRFADSKSQQKARDAINRVVVMLGDGEVAFARHLQDDRMAFHNALNTIFTDRATGRFDRRACADWLNRMTEEIPQDLSRRLSKQGYADSMTYGQMLQLLVSLEQKSYAEAIKANGREGQADLIRTFEAVGPDGRRERVLADKDIMFIDWLRSFYEAKRGMLSEVTKRMTGLPVDSPDPLYCPVKMYMGDQARGMHVDGSAAWDPIGAVFSRRVETTRDFDESASVLGQFFDRSAASANLVAWGERGSIIRGVFTDGAVQQSIRLAFGGGELTKILRQLEETFNGGENIKKAPGEIAAADKAMNWMTYLSLGYNPLSAAKQTTSFTVWANALPGGFKDLWRYMSDVDMATIKHIKESEEFKVRYGNEVGSGHDVASKGLFENPSENPVAAFFRKTSMGLLRKGDFLPGGWIAQGVFRDLYNRHLKEGMDADAADRLAMTETFNMLEETQQSGRTYNTSELAREHGRLGRLLVQFATSPLQQLQWETQALREVWDLKRYRPTTPDADFEKRYTEAKGKFIRAFVINHVMLPAALHAVTSLYRLAMGYDPEWEKEGWHWTMLRDIFFGQASRITFLGTLGTTLWDAAFTGKVSFNQTDILPVEGLIRTTGQLGKTARDIVVETWRGITAKDFAQGFDYEKVTKDLHRMLRSTSVTRTPYDILRLATGTAYAEREERREKRR